MNIDDLNGFGPETITYAGPTNGLYTVLVDGYRIGSTSTATLEVFVNGTRQFTDSRALREGDHWLVTGITVDGSTVSFVAVDRIERQQGTCLSRAPTNTGTTCLTDSACAANEFCNTSTGRCAEGCRSNASCGANQTCNANRDCVANPGTGDHGANCGETADCRSGLTCSRWLGMCTEPCGTPGNDSCSICTAATGTPCNCLEVIPGAGLCIGLPSDS